MYFFYFGMNCPFKILNAKHKCKWTRSLIWCPLSSVSCGAPPEVENAHMFGNRRDEYPVNSIIRYQCNPGFTQRHPPVVRCKADGQWEKPQVQCTDGECTLIHSSILGRVFRGFHLYFLTPTNSCCVFLSPQ